MEINDSRYFARFVSGNMELETESNDLQKLKDWVANLLATHPSPDYIVIRDTKEEVDIFEEEGKNDGERPTTH